MTDTISTSPRRIRQETISFGDNALLIAGRINNGAGGGETRTRLRPRSGCDNTSAGLGTHRQPRHLRALSHTSPPARPLSRYTIDYLILSILSAVDIGRRARVLDVIVTSYPVSAQRGGAIEPPPSVVRLQNRDVFASRFETGERVACFINDSVQR